MSEDEQNAAREAVGAAHRKLQDAEKAVEQAVVDARHVNVTWQRIADELEIAQPNAARKYKPIVDEGTPRNLWPDEADPKTLAQAAVRTADRAHRDAEVGVVQAVAAARNARVTWGEIAAEVGMLQPNAIVKFRPLLVEKVEVSVREDVGKR